jgi:hypothetical protein
MFIPRQDVAEERWEIRRRRRRRRCRRRRDSIMRWMHFTFVAGASYNRGTGQSLEQDKGIDIGFIPAMASNFGPMKMKKVFDFR